jgi:hypothetical protein
MFFLALIHIALMRGSPYVLRTLQMQLNKCFESNFNFFYNRSKNPQHPKPDVPQSRLETPSQLSR